MSHASQIATIRPFKIYRIDPDGELAVHTTLDETTLVALLQISEHNLRQQVNNAPLQIGWYSRLDSQAERVQEYLERKYAVWKSEQRILINKESEKKLSLAAVEDIYRTHTDYAAINQWLEEVRESKRAIAGLVVALKAKARRLDADIYRVADGKLARRTP